MVAFFFFVWTTIYYLSLLLNSIKTNIVIGPFDDALRLLGALYTSQGFIPYKDFAFVYPPGQILINSLFKTSTTGAIHLLVFTAALISIPLIIFAYKKTQSFLLVGIVCLLMSINFQPLTSPYTESLWIWLVLLVYFYLKHGNKRDLFFILVTSTALLFLKWERVLILSMLSGTSLIYLKIFPNYASKLDGEKILKLLKTFIFSIVLSAFLFFIYLFFYSVEFQTAFYFIFIVPFKISPYRNLPLFSVTNLAHGKIIYFYLILFIFLATNFIRKLWRKNVDNIDLFSFIFPLSVLPYALGRVDIPHLLPLITSLTLSYTYYAIKEKKIFLYILIVSILYLFHNFNIYRMPTINTQNIETNSIKECQSIIKNSKYESVFVGRIDYSRYVISYSNLYLTDVSKKSATRYISDEPGLQNSCYDGKIISQNLSNAPKPILAYIEMDKQVTEPNGSSKMNSCNHIEQWLKSNKFNRIGYCRVNSAKFEIRIYK